MCYWRAEAINYVLVPVLMGRRGGGAKPTWAPPPPPPISPVEDGRRGQVYVMEVGVVSGCGMGGVNEMFRCSLHCIDTCILVLTLVRYVCMCALQFDVHMCATLNSLWLT